MRLSHGPNTKRCETPLMKMPWMPPSCSAFLEDPDQELVPFDLVKRIAGGEHPVRVWRDYRDMKAGALAAAAGIAASYLSDIENGKKPGSVKAMKRLAAALNVTVDDLI